MTCGILGLLTAVVVTQTAAAPAAPAPAPAAPTPAPAAPAPAPAAPAPTPAAPGPAPAAPAPASPPSALAAAEPSPSDRLPVGAYRLDVEVTVSTTLPVVGEQRTSTRTTSLLMVDGDGVATAVACAVATTGGTFTSRLPPSSISALPKSRFSIVVAGDHVSADMGEGTIGWRGHGALPRTADDPRVVDADGDGVPGMRMELDLGALGTWPMQVVTRGHTALRGTKTDDGAVGSLSRMESEQQVLSGLPVDLPTSSGPVKAVASQFTLRRVDARDCAGLATSPAVARR
jgi:hypothetical protein